MHTYESMKNRWFLGSLSAVTLVMFVILAFVCCCEEAREPKRNLLQSLTKPSKAWTGCYELICCKARWKAFLKKRTVWQSLAEPELGMFFHQRIMCHCCDFCCCLASVIPAFVFCCVVASFFALERRSPGTNTSSRFGDM